MEERGVVCCSGVIHDAATGQGLGEGDGDAVLDI